MTESLSALREEEKPCRDPDCGAMAEPEVDGDHKYWVCTVCGFEFDYERVEEPMSVGDACSIGVPEDVRRLASAGMIGAMDKEEKSGPVNIGLPTIRKSE